MHAYTGISGSLPAYVYVFMEALADGGVLEGMPRDTQSSLRRFVQVTSFVAVSLVVHKIHINFYIDDMANTRRPFSLASI